MAYSTLPIAGVDLVDTVTVADIAANGGLVPFGPLGAETFANDGKIYVWAKAGATIAANTAVASIDPVTFLAIATGGAYKSPAYAMVAGDYGWFAKASV